MWEGKTGVLIYEEGGGLRNGKAFLPASGGPAGTRSAALRDGDKTPDG